MPVALETSKRKFQKLLDSLTSSASPSTPPSESRGSESSVPTAKRARLSPRTSLASAHPLVTSSTNIRRLPRATSSYLPKSAPPSAPVDIKEQNDIPPNYAPWSTPLFLKRLKTFADVSRWTEKPTPIDEVAWAKRGWVLDVTDKNKVACKGGCEERVVIGLRSREPKPTPDADVHKDDEEEDTSSVHDELVRRYTELIITGHREGCSWRDRGCADEVMRMPLARATVWQDGLLSRYQSFVTPGMEGRSPTKERLQWPPELDIENVAASLTADFMATVKDDDARAVVELSQTQLHENESSQPSIVHTPSQQPTPESTSAPQLKAHPVNITALTFALLGWSAPTPISTNPKLNAYPTAECSQCFRRLGLWLYTSSPSPATADDTDDGDTVRLDLTGSHRDYCPWTCAESQSNPTGGALEGLNGWQTLRKVVGNWAGLQERARRRRIGGEEASEPVPAQEDDAVAGETVPKENDDEDGNEVVEAAPRPARSREEVREEDNARFKRLRELRRAIGFRKKAKTPVPEKVS